MNLGTLRHDTRSLRCTVRNVSTVHSLHVERGLAPHLGVCEVQRPARVLSHSCVHQKLDKVVSVTSSRGHPECACSSSELRSSPMLLATLQLNSNQKVEVGLGLCTHCCRLVARQSLHPTFCNDQNSHRTSGCSLAYLCPRPFSLVVFALIAKVHVHGVDFHWCFFH